jgi:hypothetical protein
LNAAAEHDCLPEPTETFEGELEADPEEKENDSHLGEDLDLVSVVDQLQGGGPDEHARENETRDCGNPEAAKQNDDDDSGREDDHQVFEKLDLRHAAERSGAWPTAEQVE